MNKSKQFISSVFLSLLAVGLNYVITLLLTPYIVGNIGTEAYGFVSLAKTFANYALIFTTALNTFAARFISIEYFNRNAKKAQQYFNSVFFADAFLGTVLLLIFGIVIVELERILSIPSDLVVDVKILFLLDLLNFVILSCSTVFQVANIIKNRLDLTNIFKCIAYISEAVFLVLCFKILPPKVYYVGCGLIVSSLVILLCNVIVTQRFTPELKVDHSKFSYSALKEIVLPGIWGSLNMVGNTLNTGLDLVITNLMLSTLKVGQLSIVKTVSTIFTTLFSLLSQPFQPLLLKAYSKGDKEEVVGLFNLAIKFCGLLSNVIFAGFMVFGRIYYKLWVPSVDVDVLQFVSIITLLGLVIEGSVTPLYYVYTLTTKIKLPCLITILSGLTNVGGMFILLQFFDADLWGVVGTTTVLTWGVNFIFNPLYTARCLGVDRYTFYPSIVKNILSAVVILVIFKLISLIYYPTNWFGLIVVALGCGAIGMSVHLIITLNKKEKRILMDKVCTLINRG